MNKLDLIVKAVQEIDSLSLKYIAFENSAFIWPADKYYLMFVNFSMLIIICFLYIILNSKVIFSVVIFRSRLPNIIKNILLGVAGNGKFV